MENNGFIVLHRKLLDNPVSCKSQYFHLWVTLLLLANHRDISFIFNNQTVKLKRGQLLTGRLKLAEMTGIAPSSVNKIIKYLKREHQIEQQTTNKYSVITIINYDAYQKGNSKRNSTVTATEQQRNTYNNDNNVNNENKERERTLMKKISFNERGEIGPSVFSELSRSYDVPQEFVEDCWDSASNWLDSNGIVKKNYKAFLSNWVKKEKLSRIAQSRSFKRGGVVDAREQKMVN